MPDWLASDVASHILTSDKRDMLAKVLDEKVDQAATSIEAANVIHEFNIAMTWVSYPGRTNGIATAEEVDFATPGGVRPLAHRDRSKSRDE